MPTAVALASYDPAVGMKAQEIFSNAYFRVYTNTDVIGVELAGSIKNVVAIAAGVLEGHGLRVQYHGRAAHTRARGNGAARRGHGRQRPDLLRTGRHGRPRTDLHRRFVAEPHARRRGSAKAKSWTIS